MKLFEPGQVIVTASAMLALREAKVDPRQLMQRHVAGDWGALTEEELKSNALALDTGGPLVSNFETTAGNRVGVITAPDRSVTVFVEFPPACTELEPEVHGSGSHE